MPSTPGVISYTETVWNTTTTPKTVVISWNALDIVVCIAGREDAATIPVPTGTGITFVSQKSNNAASTCGTNLSAAFPTASGSSVTISGGSGLGGSNWGYGIFVIRGARAIGNSSEQHTATKTVALVPSAANSLLVWGCFDFEAAGAVTPNPTVPPVITRHSEDVAANYSLGIFSMYNQPLITSVSYGGVFGGVTGPYSLVVLEIPGLGSITCGGDRLRDRLKPAPFKPGSPKGRF